MFKILTVVLLVSTILWSLNTPFATFC